jgi:MFS family permease
MSFTSASAPAGTGERWVDVYLSAAGRAISTCGDFLAATALVLALQSRGAGGYAVAALLLAAAVPPVVLAPVTGRLADRVDSRVLLVVTGLAQALICVALAYTDNTAALIGLSALLAAGLAVTQPTLQALLPAMVARPHLPKAMALGQTANSIGGLLAPVLGGVLFGAFGLRIPLLVNAVSFLAIAALGLLLRTRRNARPTPGAAAAPVATEGAPAWRLRGDALLLPLIVLTGAVIAVVSAANVIEVFFVRADLHASTTVYGLVSAIWLATMMAGAWLLAKAKLADSGVAAVMLGALALTCAVFGVIALVPNVGWLIPCYVLGGILNGCLNTALGVLLGSRVPPAVRGRAFARVGAVANGANAAGYLLGGALLGVLAARPTIALVGAAGLLVAVVFAGPTVRAIARQRAGERAIAAPATPARVPAPVPAG